MKFQKTESGDFDVKKVHHNGNYVLPMPEGYDLKKILHRACIRRARRAGQQPRDGDAPAHRADGRIAGVVGLDVRARQLRR